MPEPPGGQIARFNDQLGVVPNTAYTYRVTAFAANGETGVSTLNWTAPGPFLLHWLSAAIATNPGTGNSVTLKWRCEPPATNPPALPYIWHIAAQYGLNQRTSLSGCNYLAGCTYVVNNVPSGTHKFLMTASWPLHLANGNNADPIIMSASVDTTLTVP